MSKSEIIRRAIASSNQPYYEDGNEYALSNPFGNAGGNRYIVAVGQTENERAYLTGHAMQNTAILADMERQYAEADPAGAGYYSAIMEAYTRATQETICNYGRGGKKKWR